MANQDPTFIIGSPYLVYVASVGTAPPLTSDQPAAAWYLLGAIETLSDKGVTLNTSQDVNEIFGQDTMPVKAFRVKEGLKIKFELMDLRVAALQFALNNNPVSSNAQTVTAAGFNQIGLYRGPDVNYSAMLIRGATPNSSDTNGYAQWWLPKVYQSGDIQPTYTKGNPSLLAFEWTVMKNPYFTSDANRMGTYQTYTQAANS